MNLMPYNYASYSIVSFNLLTPAITVQAHISQYYRRMRRGNAFGRACLSLCGSLSVLLRQTSKSLDLESNFWHTGTSSEHQGQASNIKDLCQGQGHTS